MQQPSGPPLASQWDQQEQPWAIEGWASACSRRRCAVPAQGAIHTNVKGHEECLTGHRACRLRRPGRTEAPCPAWAELPDLDAQIALLPPATQSAPPYIRLLAPGCTKKGRHKDRMARCWWVQWVAAAIPEPSCKVRIILFWRVEHQHGLPSSSLTEHLLHACSGIAAACKQQPAAVGSSMCALQPMGHARSRLQAMV